MCADIVIVGGGPIGCWTALQIKKRNPAAQIQVYEKSEIYKRNHVLSISRASLFQWSRDDADSLNFLRAIFEAQAIVKIEGGDASASQRLANVPHNKLAYWRNSPKVLDIRTIDFERILKAECTRLGIAFSYTEIKKSEDIMDAHPECTRFIAADGAHSKMRLGLFGKDCLVERDIYLTLDFNYQSHGQPTPLRFNTFDVLARPYAENIGVERDGVSAVNERLIVSRAEYDAITDPANFKNPVIVTPDAPFWDAMPKSRIYGRALKDDWYDLMRLRAEHANERATNAPIKMTKVPLSTYRSKKFATDVMYAGKQRTWYLVGDAAQGMPFYRAINSGLILGSQLAFLITTKLVADDWKTWTYNNYTRPCRVAREFARTARVEAKIRMYRDVWRPVMHHMARTPLAPLVKIPTNLALRHLKYGKCS